MPMTQIVTIRAYHTANSIFTLYILNDFSNAYSKYFTIKKNVMMFFFSNLICKT